MKRSIYLIVLLALVFIPQPSSVAQAGENSGQTALSWLVSRQNADGSWGADASVRPLYTSAAVGALRSFYQQNGAYYAGIAWLENHDFSNLDFQGRKAQSLLVHGDTVQSLTDRLIQARWSVSGSDGWGLSDDYSYTPLDTALALSALRSTGWNDYASALAYLESSQNGDGGWSIGPAAGSDPLTTAIVARSLCRYQSVYPQVDAAVTSAEGYLAGQVGAGDSALLRAETVLALLPNGRQTVKAYELVDSLETDQNPAGDWDDDPYATARVVRAMALALGKDPAAQGVLSEVCDAAMRSALNGALNKNAADAVTLGEMARMTSLSAAGAGIADLCGMEDATNLTYADLRNNGITSLQGLIRILNFRSSSKTHCGLKFIKTSPCTFCVTRFNSLNTIWKIPLVH